MANRSLLALLPLAAVLAACGAQPTASAGGSAGSDATVTSDAAKPAPTANQVAASLEAKLPVMKTVKVYTAADDPNHLLGRPNGYTSKMAFSDSRVPADQLQGVKADDVERGGSVEVFPDAAGATSRAQYIQQIAKSLPAAGEYDYTNGPVLIRVSRLLTPDQEKEYENAAKAVLG